MALFLTLLLATTGCKLVSHTKSALHGESPQTDSPLQNAPPAQMLMHPGPGVDGPGPGVLYPDLSAAAVGGAAGAYCPPGGLGAGGLGVGGLVGERASQMAFVGPVGMQVQWDVSAPGMFDSPPLVVPGRYNFPQGAIYRIKLTNIPARPGVELYPTIEVGPAMPRTDAYLAHNAIPVQFTEEDFDQVLTGNFVTKVIYLPDPEFQELAVAGVETLVSTRLDPGIDPIVEADRRGAIMAIVRMGNKDLQMRGPAPELVSPVAYNAAVAGAMPGGYPAMGYDPHGAPIPMGPAASPPYVAGVTTPMYGMPYVGTPIGLPGPPHIPLGGPAGLQRHVIRDHTHHNIPGPTHKFTIDVRQQPGFEYPLPVNKVHINETAHPTPPVGGHHHHGQYPNGYPIGGHH
jgi:hypothetical protein